MCCILSQRYDRFSFPHFFNFSLHIQLVLTLSTFFHCFNLLVGMHSSLNPHCTNWMCFNFSTFLLSSTCPYIFNLSSTLFGYSPLSTLTAPTGCASMRQRRPASQCCVNGVLSTLLHFSPPSVTPFLYCTVTLPL